VKGVDRRVITGQIVITESDSKLHETPCVQTIQLDVSELICGEDYKKITTINSSFDALYPLKIEKKRSTVIEKVDPNLNKEPKSQVIQRPNQVWDITANEWKTVPKPQPRNRAWVWYDETLSWVCQKNEETGELMPLDRTDMTDYWPARKIRAPKQQPTNGKWVWNSDKSIWVCEKRKDTNSMPFNRTGMTNFWPALELNPAVPSNPLDTPNSQDLPNPSNPNPSNPADEND
jgi:hypothetical protein